MKVWINGELAEINGARMSLSLRRVTAFDRMQF